MNHNEDPTRPEWMSRWSHLKCKYLVFANERFIVYIDEDIDVDWETGEEYIELGPEEQKVENEILNDAATIETVPCDHLHPDIKLKFKRLIGEAIARCLSHDHRNARKMLAVANAYINARNREMARYWYLKASGITAILMLAFGLFVWYYRDGVISVWGDSAFLVFLAVSSGAAGAMLSIALRVGSAVLDSTAGKILHYLEAVSRIAVGGLSGVLVTLAINAGVILPPLLQSDRPLWGMLLVSMAAGASERLASSLIEKINAWQLERPYIRNSQAQQIHGDTNEEASAHNSQSR